MFHTIGVIFHTVFYRPILNGLLFLTSVVPFHDLGLSLILLTLAIRALMFPLSHKMLKTQHVMKKIEPEIKKIRGQKKSKEEEAREIMWLYKEHGIDPFSWMLVFFIQLPLIIALYQVFLKGLPFRPEEVYSFLTIPTNINSVFLGIISLNAPSKFIAALAGISQFIQVKLAVPPGQKPSRDDMGAAIQKQMMYVFPVMIFFLGFSFPAAVSLYWTIMNVFAIIHEAIVRRRFQ